MRRALLHSTLFLAAPLLHAQEVEMRLDTAIIRLGERAQLIIDVTAATTPTVTWPVVGDTLRAQVEVVRRQGPDTLISDGTARLRTVYDLTSFDAGFWAIPPFTLQVNGKPRETEALVLEVRAVEAPADGALRPAKPVMGPRMEPWLLWITDHLLHLGGGVLLLALLLFLLLRKRPDTQPMQRPLEAPVLTLRERTLNALAAVRDRKLWQQGMVKEHHAGTTDILRAFIEERYHVPALERTTDELLRQLRLSSMAADQREQLGNMLRLADLVKFAKLAPGALENEHLIEGAMQFVRDTPEPTPPTDAQ